MKTYPKIQSVFKREKTKKKVGTFIEGDWSCKEFEYLQNTEWIWTEKIDGTNIRVIYEYGGEISFRGRTDKAQIPNGLLSKLLQIFNTEEMLACFRNTFQTDLPVCLYGEGYGGNIQTGKNYSNDYNFILFDVKVGDLWLTRSSVEDIGKMLGVNVVPIVGQGSLINGIEKARAGFRTIVGQSNALAEGLVMFPSIHLQDRQGKRIITKAKYRDFIVNRKRGEKK